MNGAKHVRIVQLFTLKGQLWSSREGFKSRPNLGRPIKDSSRRHSPHCSKFVSWSPASRADHCTVLRQLCCIFLFVCLITKAIYTSSKIGKTQKSTSGKTQMQCVALGRS